MRSLMMTAALTLALTGGAGLAETSMGILTPQLPIGVQDGAWAGSEAGGAFTLLNQSDPTALRYYFATPGEAVDATVGVDVLLGPSSDAQAFGGILFSFDPETRHYHIFALGGDGTVQVFNRDGGGLGLMMQSTSDSVKVGAWNRLEIVETGDQVSLSVNGVSVGSIGSEGLGAGGLGIVAAGLVQAGFANFTAEDANGPIGAGQ